MSDQTDRSAPPFKQPLSPADAQTGEDHGTDASDSAAVSDTNRTTGDQLGGQSSNSESEIADRDAGEAAPSDAGEDEGGTATEGRDDHLKEDQKPTTK